MNVVDAEAFEHDACPADVVERCVDFLCHCFGCTHEDIDLCIGEVEDVTREMLLCYNYREACCVGEYRKEGHVGIALPYLMTRCSAGGDLTKNTIGVGDHTTLFIYTLARSR